MPYFRNRKDFHKKNDGKEGRVSICAADERRALKENGLSSQTGRFRTMKNLIQNNKLFNSSFGSSPVPQITQIHTDSPSCVPSQLPSLSVHNYTDYFNFTDYAAKGFAAFECCACS